MNGVFAQTLAPRPWTPGVSPGGGVAPMPPAPAPQPVFTPGVGRRPAIVIGTVEEGQAAVFADNTGHALKSGGSPLSREAVRSALDGVEERVDSLDECCDVVGELVHRLKTI